MILVTSTQNCLADCLTKASGKADNLITAVQTGKLLDVGCHNTHGAQGVLVNLVKNILAHTGEGSFVPGRSQDRCCTLSPRRTISSDVCGDSAAKEAK